MVRSFYALAFCMTVLYALFQINQVVTGGVPTMEEVLANNVNFRNGSLSCAKVFDFILSLQIDYTMLKLSLSIKVNLGEITYCDKVQQKNKFQFFAGIMTFFMLIEVILVYTEFNQEQACLANAITFWALTIINIIIMCYLLKQLSKLKEETFHSEKKKI